MRAGGTRQGGARRVRRWRGVRSLLAVITAAVLLVGCTSAGHTLPTETSTPVASGSPSAGLSAADAAAMEKYYTQSLVWSDCSGGFQCATAKAPLDWAHPAKGDPISLALIRKPATGPKLGSLFVNPGGPGEPGVAFVRNSVGNTSATLQKNFDVIGWDPRGVGQSSAVKCYDDAGTDDYLYSIPPGTRGSPEWLDANKQAVEALGQACYKNTGELLGHVDTASTAHDLDMLRANVGDTKLNYLGFSYGTMIGALYADMFPKNVGRMTLDGVVDPASSMDEITELQAQGFESNLRAYAQWCLTQDRSCPFKGSVDQVMNSIAALLDQVQKSPIKNADGRMLGASTLLLAIITPLYNTATWSSLDVLFKNVEAGSAKVAFILADDYNDRDSNGKYTSNTQMAFQAINCLDYPMDTDLAHMQAEAQRIAQVAPVMGPFFSYGDIACWNWPFAPTRTPAPVHAKGSGPILVIGTTNDPATPYQQSVNLAHDLENGHLVTWNGSGHTAYGRSNSCVTNTVDDYFVKGTVPPTDPKC